MLKVLHLVGSTESEKSFKNCLYFAIACKSYDDFDFAYAVIKPDETWTFTRDLAKFVLDDGGSDESVVMNLPEAIQHISGVIKPDVAIHHLHCKNGSIYFRSLMELLHIPLVGPTSKAVSITKNKAITSAMLKLEGSVATAKCIYVNKCLLEGNPDTYSAEVVAETLGLPCVVKAVSVEDSLGVFKVKCKEDLGKAIDEALRLDDEVLIEEFIVGTEMRCGVIEDENGHLEVLPMIKYPVDPNEIRYHVHRSDVPINFREKYDILKPSEKNSHLLELVSNAALKVYKTINLRDFGLFDFRVHEKTGVAYLLEVNLFCSFGDVSFLNVMAREAGYTDRQLLNIIVKRAIKRT